jgi:hypothetical protein
MSWNTGLARIGAVLYVLWGLVHYNAAYGVYQHQAPSLARLTPAPARPLPRDRRGAPDERAAEAAAVAQFDLDEE